MFSKKLTKTEREVLRAQRCETQLITMRARADKSNFIKDIISFHIKVVWVERWNIIFE